MITPPVPRVGELEFFWNGAGIHLFVRVYLLFVYLFVFTHCSYICTAGDGLCIPRKQG